MIHHVIEQRTEAWERLRWYRLCGTDAAALVSTKKNGEPTAARLALVDRLVAEGLTPFALNDRQFVSRDMQHGIEYEAEAVAAYEAYRSVLVDPGGFIAHEDVRAGCSPDGIVGNFAGLVEIKVPKPATHLSYLRDGVLPKDYHAQVLHQLVISGVPYVDFVSYAPEFPPHLQLFCVRYEPDATETKSYELLLRMFLGEIEREVERLHALAAVA